MRVVGGIGLAIIVGQNLFDRVQGPDWQGPNSPTPTVLQSLWMLLHQGGFFPAGTPAALAVHAFYALLPWIGVITAGHA